MKSFEADPEFVCVPGESELSWEVTSRDSVTMTLSVDDTDAEPPLLSEFPVRRSDKIGSLDVTVPEGRTVFRIRAGGSDSAATETTSVIGMGSESLTNPITFDPNCADTGAVNGWRSVEFAGYDDAIRPRSVMNTSDRVISITHAGVTRSLAPRETSSAWNGTQLSGRWTVSAELLSRAPRGAGMVTESCDPGLGPGGSVSPTPGDSTRTIPLQPLTASVTFGCDAP
ncbi:MAG: hypothetical protein AAF767_01685 [Pseudomonadota bacterium]